MNTSNINFLLFDLEAEILFVDASSYNPDVPIQGPSLVVIPPNYVTKYFKAYNPNHTTLIEPGMFNFHCPLEDGIYMVEASICPQDQLFKRVGYLRTYNTEKLLASKIDTATKNNTNLCEYYDMWVQLLAAKNIAACNWDRANIIFESVKSRIENCYV